MLPSAPRLTFRTYFDPTMLVSFGSGTNFHVSLLINKLYSAFKASFKDCGSSFSAVKDSDMKHSSG